jgi:hypothetical protein
VIGCRQEIQCISIPTARERTSQSPTATSQRTRLAWAEHVPTKGEGARGDMEGGNRGRRLGRVVCLLFYAANPRDWGSCWWAHAEEALHHCSLSRMRPIWRLVIIATRDLPCSGQVKMDTKLSHLPKCFVFIGADIPQIRMLPPTVVEHLDIIDHIIAGFLPCRVIPMRRTFALQATQKPLRHCIV